jgi:hypothetical protein
MVMLCRFVCAARSLLTSRRSRRARARTAPELWCRSDTLLTLRGRATARECIRAWHMPGV